MQMTSPSKTAHPMLIEPHPLATVVGRSQSSKPAQPKRELRVEARGLAILYQRGSEGV